MSESSLMLQTAVFAAVKLEAAIGALIGERFYDSVPAKASFPYANWEDDGVNDDSADCITGSEIFFSIHVWSRAKGRAEVKRIAGAFRDLLDENELTVADHHLVTLTHRSTRVFMDADALTCRAIVLFRALVDEA